MTKGALPARWRSTTIGEIAREKPNNGIFRKNPEYLANGSEGMPVVWVEELFRKTRSIPRNPADSRLLNWTLINTD